MNTNKYVTLDVLEKRLRKIDGMPELIDSEYASLRAAEFVKETRESANLSRTALAHKLGVSAARITQLESGEGRYGPSVALLARIVEACGGTLQLSVKADPVHAR